MARGKAYLKYRDSNESDDFATAMAPLLDAASDVSDSSSVEEVRGKKKEERAEKEG